MTPPFTKQELADYVKKRGFQADIDKWYAWYVKHNFRYKSGKRWYNLKNWKLDVLHKLKHGKFNAEPLPSEEQLAQRRRIKGITQNMFKLPYMGFRSKQVFNDRRRMNLDKLKR